jgi:hypothetical protein
MMLQPTTHFLTFHFDINLGPDMLGGRYSAIQGLSSRRNSIIAGSGFTACNRIRNDLFMSEKLPSNRVGRIN